MKTAKVLTWIVSIALGLGVGSWVTGLTQPFYIQKVHSDEELNSYTMWVFLVSASMLCSLFCWASLKLLKRAQDRRSA